MVLYNFSSILKDIIHELGFFKGVLRRVNSILGSCWSPVASSSSVVIIEGDWVGTFGEIP